MNTIVNPKSEFKVLPRSGADPVNAAMNGANKLYERSGDHDFRRRRRLS